MPGSRDVHHLQVVLADYTIEVSPDERLAGIGSPVPKQSILEVFRTERLFEQWVIAKVNHPGAEIIACAPICIDLAKLIGAKCLFGGSVRRFQSLCRCYCHKDQVPALGSAIVPR